MVGSRQTAIKTTGSKCSLISLLLSFATVFGCFIFYLPAFSDVEYCDVYVGTRKVFVVTNSHVLSAVERGEEINDRLKRIVKDPALDLSKLSVRSGLDGVPMIMLGNLPICEVTGDDAAPSGESPQSVANEWMVRLRGRLEEERQVAKKEAPQSDKKESAHGDKEGTTLGEHAVLLLFVEIAILLFASLAFGELMVRFGQPAIIGQCFAGVMLGQTVFGNFFPDLSALVFPQDNLQSKLISVVSWIGVSFILMLTGMETDVSMLKRLGKPALYFALIGLVIPLLVGGGISFLLPQMLMQDTSQKIAFAVFVGTVFAASSVPVVAQVLMDLKMLKHDIGQLVLSASLSHDLLSCLLLAVIAVLSGSGKETHGNPIVTATIGTICFLLVMYFGRPVFFFILRGVNDKVSTADGLITAMIVLLLSCAAVTQALGVHIVLGAFAAGVILSQTPVVNSKVIRPLEIMTMGFFAPIFFASAGLNVNLSCLLDPKLAIITLLLSLAAVASKLGSCYYAGKLAGMGPWESLAVGAGANTKGSMGLILAILGYSLHIISIEMFAMVIFVSLFTTAVSPGLMKWTLGKVKFSDEENQRIAKQERLSRTILRSVRRVLWPTSGRLRNQFIGKLLNSIGEKQVLETVLLWVTQSAGDGEKPFNRFANVLDRKHIGVLQRIAHSSAPAEAIIDEAKRGYDLIVMATDKPAANVEYVFGKTVDDVILKTSSRVLVVFEPDEKVEREIKRVLVPVSGSELSISAGEFGMSLAQSLRAKVTCLCIAESDAQELYSDKTRSGEKIQTNITQEIEGTLAELGNALDVEFEALLINSTAHPAQAIILTAQQQGTDLIVLGAEPKLGKSLFLGHTINFILRNAPCAVAVLKMHS